MTPPVAVVWKRLRHGKQGEVIVKACNSVPRNGSCLEILLRGSQPRNRRRTPQ